MGLPLAGQQGHAGEHRLKGGILRAAGVYPEAPAAPEGKEFDKWVVETDDGGNVTITATYKDREPQKPETITVTWKNGETGETIKELNDKYPKGTPADGVSADDYPGAPEMPGKEFREWTLETDADGNIIITAIYRVKENPELDSKPWALREITGICGIPARSRARRMKPM